MRSQTLRGRVLSVVRCSEQRRRRSGAWREVLGVFYVHTRWPTPTVSPKRKSRRLPPREGEPLKPNRIMLRRRGAPGSSSGQQQPGSRAGARWRPRGSADPEPLPPRTPLRPLFTAHPPRACQAPTPVLLSGGSSRAASPRPGPRALGPAIAACAGREGRRPPPPLLSQEQPPCAPFVSFPRCTNRARERQGLAPSRLSADVTFGGARHARLWWAAAGCRTLSLARWRCDLGAHFRPDGGEGGEDTAW